MASVSRSGSSRRKPEVPGRIRLQLKGKSSKILESDDEVLEGQNDIESPVKEDVLIDNIIPDDLPEGTVVVQPQAVEDVPVKKKKEAPVRIDTSILDNVSCTACGRQLNPYKSSALQKHPELKVVICKRCDKFLSSGEIAKDKDGTDEQCRWCGEGGRLVVCDQCTSAFCRACVMRNFNRSEFTNINSQTNWKCYLCDNAPLQGLREKYRKIRDTLKALQARDKAKASAAATPSANGTGRSENSLGSKQPSSKSVPSASVAKKVSSTQNSKNEKLSSLQGDIVTLKDFTVNFDKVDIVMDKVSTATNTFRGMLTALRSQFHSTSPCKPEDTPPMFQFSFSNTMDLQEKKRRCAKAFDMGLQTYVKSLISILSDSPESVKIKENQNVIVAASKKSSLSVSNNFSEHSTSKAVDDHKKLVSSNTKSMPLSNKKIEAITKVITKDPSKNKSNAEENVSNKERHENNSEDATSNNNSVNQLSETRINNEVSASKSVIKVSNKEKDLGSEYRNEKAKEKLNKDSLSKVTSEVKNNLEEKNDEKLEKKDEKLEKKDEKLEKNAKSDSHPDVHSKIVDSEENSSSEKQSGNNIVNELSSLDENLAAKNDLLKEFADLDEGMETGDTNVDLFSSSELEDKSSSRKEKVDESSYVKNVSKKTKKIESIKPDVLKSDDKPAKKAKSSASKVDTEKKTKKSKEESDERDSDSDLLYMSEDEAPSPKEANSKKKVMESKATGLKLKISTKVEDKAPEASKDKAPEASKDKAPEISKDKALEASKEDKAQVNGKESVEENVDEIDKEIDKLSKLPTVRKRKVKDIEDTVEESEKAEPEKKAPRLSKPGPKSSKKANDYDDLSSDGEDKRVSDHDSDDDDDDGPTVTFCVEPEKSEEAEIDFKESTDLFASPVESGGNRKRKITTHNGPETKRYSELNKMPVIGCCHNTKRCQGSLLTQADVEYFFNLIHKNRSKVKQNSLLMCYLNIKQTTRHRPRKDAVPRTAPTVVDYHLRKADGEVIKVCCKTFQAATGIKKDRLLRLVKSYSKTGSLPVEKRGGSRRKVEDLAVELSITKWIEQYKYGEWNQSVGRDLPPGLSLAAMWRDWKANQSYSGGKLASISKFKKIFYTLFNVGSGDHNSNNGNDDEVNAVYDDE